MDKRTPATLAALALLALLLGLALLALLLLQVNDPGKLDPAPPPPTEPEEPTRRERQKHRPPPPPAGTGEDAAEKDVPPAEKLAPLHITVLHVDGRPATNATIRARIISGHGSRPGATLATADANGFAALNPAPDVEEIVAVAGHEISLPAKCTRLPGGPIEMTLQLTPGALVAGRVADPSGRGISAARLTATPKRSDGEWAGRSRSRVADDEGRYEFDPVPLTRYGGWWMVVRADGFAPVVTTLETLRAGRNPLDVNLQPGLRVILRAIDDEGKPIPGLRVLSYLGLGETDEDGRLESGEADPGHPWIRILSQDYADRFLRVPAGSRTADFGDVRIERGSPLTGRVATAGRAPRTTLEVDLHDGETDTKLAEDRAPNGRFEFERVGARPHRVRPRYEFEGSVPGVQQTLPAIEVPSGQPRVDLTVPAPIEFLVELVSAEDGAPVEVEKLWIWVQRGDGTFVVKDKIERRRPTGSARILLFEQGVFDLIVNAGDHDRVRVGALDARPGEPIPVRIPLR